MIAHTSFLYERRTISRKLFDDYFYMMKIPEMCSLLFLKYMKYVFLYTNIPNKVSFGQIGILVIIIS